MSIDNTGDLFFEQHLGTQLSWMYSGIESTMKKESSHACALLLSTYTEVLGGFVTGKLKDSHAMRNNYVTFLKYLGDHYVSLQETYDLYSIVRNKLVHEFSPRPSYIIWINEIINNNKFGIEITNGHLDFNLKEYYRDFRNGIDNYRSDLGINASLVLNLTKALEVDWENATHRRGSNL